MTPHLGAKVLAEKIGMRKVSDIPGFAHVEGKPRTVSVYRAERQKL